MRKSAIVVASTLLIALNAFAANGQTTMDAKSMANTIVNMHKFTGSEKGSFAMVYGGQDISRTHSGQVLKMNEPVLIG